MHALYSCSLYTSFVVGGREGGREGGGREGRSQTISATQFFSLQFLNELLLSQREGDRQCAIVTLDVDEIDPLRPEGFKCIPPTNSPTVLAPTASVIPSPVATGELPKGNTGNSTGIICMYVR